MSPRSEVAWEEWEEKNLLPWLDAHRALPWKARSHAYSAQYQVGRSVESLRGKKYHILRKQRRIGARTLEYPGHPSHPSHPSRAGAHRSAGHKASLANITRRRPAQINIDKRFQTILTTETSQIDSIESTKRKGSRPGRAMPLLCPLRREETRSSTQIWNYVHRVCAARKLRYRRAEHPCYQQFVGICATSRSRSSNSNYLDELVLLDVATNAENGKHGS
ncbi:hypothetical protein EN45_041690 [Penicillium chrysogenum]|uniref:Uncharacterized protein n=2 Tax=Penicillium chrysogenum species complex TaxID=254878 RepID=B6GWL1_PENRW|nr:hypothetical protein EN45_041690 [Penicillium chrysogenum]CAP79262.1 hypothetical protein PCH_Pc09g00150 [Penicillium rubens Wisconsin 54-1255]